MILFFTFYMWLKKELDLAETLRKMILLWFLDEL